MLYVISFIVGVVISLILYGKVPVFITWIIAAIVGGLIGYVNYKIKQKKAEKEHIKWIEQFTKTVTNQKIEL